MGIEGSNYDFYSYIEGSGGLNEIKLDYGYAVSDNFRVGAFGFHLFGKITENEINYISDNIMEFNEFSRYSGFRLGLGLQYDVTENYLLLPL